MKIASAQKNHVGKVRAANDDSLLVANESRMYFIADGFGEEGKGKIASEYAIRTVRDFLFQEKDWYHPIQIFQHAIEQTNKALRTDLAKTWGDLQIGTTLTLLMFRGQDYFIGHVGDSRCYRLRQGVVQLLTCDHSLVNDMVLHGQLTAEEASSHPDRHILTRAVGTQDTIQVATYQGSVQKGDIFLLCTDGLYDGLSIGELKQELFLAEMNLELAAHNLVDIALAHGGSDNISFILVNILEL